MDVATHQPEDEEFTCPVCLNILLEPTTLTCGHNICRGCLAGWYLSNVPRKNECPTCRQKWEGFPQVNKTLRNIIERREAEALVERRQEVADNQEYQECLTKFEEELQGTRTQVVDANQNASFFAGVAVAIAAVVVVYFIVYWSGSGDREKARSNRPVATWGTGDVSGWLRSMGWAANYSGNADRNSIDGPTLLYSNETYVMDKLNVTDSNHRNALLLALQSLKEVGVAMPQTVWEYKELFPGRTLYFSYALKDFPRCAVLYMYLFYYNDCFLPFIHAAMPRVWDEELKPSVHKLPDPETSQLLMFLLFMLVFPYGMIGLFAWSLRSAHTITHLVVMTTCIFQTLFELSFFSSCITRGDWRQWKAYLHTHMKQILSMLFYVGLWPVTPSFVCSFFFYVCLYMSPIQLAKRFYEIVTRRNELL
ncbi:bifunctional apoptosis regulator-like [Littorina saxatilis]|uniref:RING-type domain-containing protein n=1 Tax=Littorina saxatilis TaxID=31220 RepID=A0AAN9BWQ8_9CAEN